MSGSDKTAMIIGSLNGLCDYAGMRELSSLYERAFGANIYIANHPLVLAHFISIRVYDVVFDEVHPVKSRSVMDFV